MSDLNKIMEKMKAKREDSKGVEEKEKPTKEVEEVEEVEEEEIPKEEVKEVEEKHKSLDDDDDGSEEKVEVKSPAKEEKVEDKENPIEQEVGLLQNNGVFRRELILTLKEFVNLQKVNTQTLLDVKELLGGENGKKQ
jgi:hypothetical protein